MDFSYSLALTKNFAEIKTNSPQLLKKVEKQLEIFRKDSRHTSLRTHKLTGNLSDSYSISIDRSMRMLFRIKNGKAVFYKIGTHDQVYGKK